VEFTKDEFVVEGKVKIIVRTIHGDYRTGSADKVTLKNNWVIFQDDEGVSVFNRENISLFDIEFEEG
jgi:hypothetical protein